MAARTPPMEVLAVTIANRPVAIESQERPVPVLLDTLGRAAVAQRHIGYGPGPPARGAVPNSSKFAEYGRCSDRAARRANRTDEVSALLGVE